MKLAIVIPAYNEEKSIETVLNKIPKSIDGIDEIITIVVDDGSTDDTFEISRKKAKYVLRHIVNMGVGAATITGLSAAKKFRSDVAVTIDADDQHDPSDIAKLVYPIVNGLADVVIGSRMSDTNDMPPIKIIGNWFMNFLTFLVFRKWTSDSQSGLKAFNKKAISKMCFHSIGYEICSEIIGEVQRNKLRLIEIPVSTIYSKYSKAKGQSWLNGINILTKMIVIKITGRK